MVIDTPFRRAITSTSFTKKSRGTNPSYKHKLHNYVLFPDISINSVWRGASEIVATLAFDGSTGIAFFDNVPTNPNYVAVIAWVVSPGIMQRYKLWEDVGEILYVDLYAGQAIGAGAVIEIWNTPTTPTLVEGFALKTSILSIPTCSCEMTDHTANAVYTQCTDITLNLIGWNPYRGDYFQVIGCGVTELIIGAGVASIKLKADDGTWHDFYLISQFGIIDYQIDQDPTTPGDKDYFPFIFDGQVIPMSLTLNGGAYQWTLGAPIVDADAAVSLLLTLGGNTYPVYLTSLTNIQIGQDPV